MAALRAVLLLHNGAARVQRCCLLTASADRRPLVCKCAALPTRRGLSDNFCMRHARQMLRACALWAGAMPWAALAAQAPATPPSLPPCDHILAPHGSLPRQAGESLRYRVEVSGVDVGTVDFQIAKAGASQGNPAVEYRSVFALDALAAAVLPVQGRAAALVSNTAFWPQQSMSQFAMGTQNISETLHLAADGSQVHISLRKGTTNKASQRTFPTPVVDFVTGFYLLRRSARQAPSCAIVYGNERAYTVWLNPQGVATVKTPLGMRPAQRVDVRFASERAKKVTSARLYLGYDTARLPLLVQIDTPHPLVARLHRYAPF